MSWKSKNISKWSYFEWKRNRISRNSNSASLNQSDSNDSLAGFLRDDNYQENSELESEVKITLIENEKVAFSQMIEQNDFGTTSTKTFRMKNKTKLPHLKDLAGVLINIPSAAAFIERYYSLCGNICETKSGNMGKKQIMKRSLLKGNKAITKQLSENWVNLKILELVCLFLFVQ